MLEWNVPIRLRSGAFASARPFGLAFPFVLLLAGATDARQLALVVGNSDYQTIADVKTSAGDAEAVAEVLRRLNYDVTLLTDATGAEFDAALKAMAEAADAETPDNTLFFFAGQAFQYGGANYFVPVDAALNDRATLGQEIRSVDEVIGRISSPAWQSFVFLDAGLTNPMPAEIAGDKGGAGLAKMAARNGALVGYAAQPGSVPVEAEGDRSPFTTALLAHIEEPGISISDMMVLVRNDVEKATEGKQKPWDRSALRAQFYFNPVYETSAALTASDYEMLADLDPEVKGKLLALLSETGVSLEIEVLEEAELQLASIEQSVVIEALDDEPEPVADPTRLLTASTSPLMEIIALPEEGEAVPVAQTAAPQPDQVVPSIVLPAEPQGSVAIAQPTGSVSQAEVVPSAPAAESAPTTQAAPTVAIATPTVAAATSDVDRVAAAPGTVVAPTSGETATIAATPGAAPAANAESAPMVLAAVEPDRALSPGADSQRIVGQEVVPDAPSEAVAALPEPAPQPVEIEIPENLPRAVQAELARLGCYRSGVDGIWGKGSALSLVRYFSAKKTAPDTLEPTADLYVALKQEENVVCKLTSTTAKIAPPKSLQTTAAKPAGKKVISTTTTTSTGQKKAVKRITTGVFR